MRSLLIGTYTPDAGEGRGMYRAMIGPDGRPENLALVAEQPNPSYLAWHPTGDSLYAVAEGTEGAVVHYRRQGDALAEQGRRPVAPAPCHVVAAQDGRGIVVASYGDGTVTALPLHDDGSFADGSSSFRGEGSGPNATRQEGPHAHAALIAPDGTVLSTDLGTDRVIASRLDAASGKLEVVGSVALPAGWGPRHLALHPSGTVFVLTELHSAIVVLEARDSYAELSVAGDSAATHNGAQRDGLYPAAIRVSDDGRRVYTSERGSDLITTHEVAADGRSITAIDDVPSGGSWPRDLVLDGRGLYVANERSSALATFRCDEHGIPKPQGEPIAVPSPVCLLVSP